MRGLFAPLFAIDGGNRGSRPLSPRSDPDGGTEVRPLSGGLRLCNSFSSVPACSVLRPASGVVPDRALSGWRCPIEPTLLGCDPSATGPGGGCCWGQRLALRQCYRAVGVPVSAIHPPPMNVEDITDVYVRIECDLLVVGDSILTDRHHASNGNYDADDPQNQIGGLIPAYPLSGWLRHGMEAVVQERGGTACHPGEANANFQKADVYERDLDAGYHEKGACVEAPTADDGCIVFDLFGGFNNQPGKLLRRPIKFSPVRSSVAYERGQAEGHYRRLNRNVVSRNAQDNREPLRNTAVDAVANLDGCWQLSFRDATPAFLGLLAEAIEYLDAHNTDFMHQLGGSRNFGGGIVDCDLITPLYTERELRRIFDRGKGTTNAMDEKDQEWAETHRPEIETALAARIDGDDE